MEQKIKGNNYYYLIAFSKGNFRIIATNKGDHRKSSITNLNIIIGEIIEPVLEANKIEDSWIEVDSRKGKKLFELAVDTFKNAYWIKYLEKNLDEDEERGGWN